MTYGNIAAPVGCATDVFRARSFWRLPDSHDQAALA
jgi:hypothetical protein